MDTDIKTLGVIEWRREQKLKAFRGNNGCAVAARLFQLFHQLAEDGISADVEPSELALGILNSGKAPAFTLKKN